MPVVVGPAYGRSVQIREAAPADWPKIYPFFSAIVAAGETYAYPEGTSAGEAEALWMERPPGRTVVAVDGDDVLGSAKMGPNRPGRGAHIATASFMVDPAHAGRGVGRALGEYVIEWARRNGYERTRRAPHHVPKTVTLAPELRAHLSPLQGQQDHTKLPSARAGGWKHSAWSYGPAGRRREPRLCVLPLAHVASCKLDQTSGCESRPGRYRSAR